MKRRLNQPYFKFKLIFLLVFCQGFLLLPAVRAANIPRAPQGAQLLPQNPRQNVQTFPSDTTLSIEQPTALLNISSNETLCVRKIKIVGNTIFDTHTLHRLVSREEGKIMSLSQLNQLANCISQYYQQHGYPFSRAYIPAQSIKNGLIQFNILEARYGALKIENRSRLACCRAKLYLKPLHRNDLIERSKLNRSLLLLNDLSGIRTQSIISPGKTVGHSDLLVLIEPAASVNGSLGMDNYGSPYTGRFRYNGSLQFNNPTGQGDQILIEGLTTGRNLMYGHFGYNFPVYPGVNIGTNYYGMTYRLKNDLDPFQPVGNLNIADAWLIYDWVRRDRINFSSTLRYVYKNMHDNYKAVGIYKMRHSNALRLENSAELRDNFGTTNLYLAVAQGVLTFNRSVYGQNIDAISPNTAGRFTRANLHISRLQQLTENTSLYLGADGQLASKNLDSSEQLVFGGPFIIRSYDVGTLSGTQGYTANAELRYLMNMEALGLWRSLMFVDAGRLQINKYVFTRDPNLFNLYSAGLGLDITWKGWDLSGRYAHRLGAPPPPNIVSLIDNDQIWVQVSKRF